MVLAINGETLVAVPKITSSELYELVIKDEGVIKEAKTYREQSIKRFFNNKESFYVQQGHYAPCEITDLAPLWIGTDDATSCHIVVFYQKSRCLVCHLDFENRIAELIHRVIDFMNDVSEPISVLLVGGFRNEIHVGKKLLQQLYLIQRVLFDLKLCCVGVLNSLEDNNICYPFCMGGAFCLSEKRLIPAKFDIKARDPVGVLQNALSYTSRSLKCTFHPSKYYVLIEPFHIPFKIYPNGVTREILSEMSTTPLQEPEEYYTEALRLKKLLDTHENIVYSIFKSPSAYILFGFYRGTGWVPMSDIAKQCLSDSIISAE